MNFRITNLLPFFDKKSFLLSLFLLLAIPCFARTKSDFEVAGDITQILLPISAATYSLCLKDYEGIKQFSYAFSSSLATTYALKYSVNRTRPDGTDYSFPSGHTTAAFSAASFIHFRYGWGKAIPAYVLASYVGYSRVRADRHYQSDVYAGAIIATGFSYLYTTHYAPKDLQIVPLVGKNFQGVSLTYRF